MSNAVQANSRFEMSVQKRPRTLEFSEMATLQLDSRGHEVVKLQLLLDGQLPVGQRVKADGSFGEKTKRAVMTFQASHQLQPDGVVGPATLKALGINNPSLFKQPPEFSLGQILIAPWMATAVAEYGVHRDAIAHRNKRIIEYLHTTTMKGPAADTDSTPWCSAFVNWVMIKSGKQGTNDALAASWLEWKGGRPVKPTFGAIIVIKKHGATPDHHTGSSTGNHVGFCVSADPSRIALLGGNQGSQVTVSNFSLAKWGIRGARWPN